VGRPRKVLDEAEQLERRLLRDGRARVLLAQLVLGELLDERGKARLAAEVSAGELVVRFGD